MAVAGFKLRNAFNHFVFIDVLDEDILRSLRGDPGSILPKNSSFCKEKTKKKKTKKREKKTVREMVIYQFNLVDCWFEQHGNITSCAAFDISDYHECQIQFSLIIMCIKNRFAFAL